MMVERLEHKLGIRASDTATIRFTDCRVPAENLLGSPEIDAEQGFAGVDADLRQHPSAGRGDGRRLRPRRARPDPRTCSRRPASRSTTTGRRYAQQRGRRDAPADGGRLGGRLPADARGGLDGRQPQAQLAGGLDGQGQGRPGRPSTITLRCVELAGSLGYSESELLEKWARDSKILDIFEGTQQIQQLIVARRLLDKTSAELK